MGVATGCGCKEVYRFPHTTYPYSSCICSFCSSIPTFCSFCSFFCINTATEIISTPFLLLNSAHMRYLLAGVMRECTLHEKVKQMKQSKEKFMKKHSSAGTVRAQSRLFAHSYTTNIDKIIIIKICVCTLDCCNTQFLPSLLPLSRYRVVWCPHLLYTAAEIYST